jgi:hypothetical protein
LTLARGIVFGVLGEIALGARRIPSTAARAPASVV